MHDIFTRENSKDAEIDSPDSGGGTAGGRSDIQLRQDLTREGNPQHFYPSRFSQVCLDLNFFESQIRHTLVSRFSQVTPFLIKKKLKSNYTRHPKHIHADKRPLISIESYFPSDDWFPAIHKNCVQSILVDLPPDILIISLSVNLDPL